MPLSQLKINIFFIKMQEVVSTPQHLMGSFQMICVPHLSGPDGLNVLQHAEKDLFQERGDFTTGNIM